MGSKNTGDQLGICNTCNHREFCTSRENWIGPIFHCEEFEDRGAPSAGLEIATQQQAVEKSVSPPVLEAEEPYQGLCINCDSRENCSYRLRNGRVVWFCEEYSVAPLPLLIPDTLLPPFGIKHPVTRDLEAGWKPIEVDENDIEAILQRRGKGPGVLITLLEEIQSIVGYLPEDVIRLVSKKTGCSLVDLYGIATFYRSFNLRPRGRDTISVCLGTACHVRGASIILEEFKRHLGVEAGETTADGSVTLETVNCLGACALGPIVVGGKRYFSRVEPIKVKDIVKKVSAKSGTAEVRNDPRFFPISVRCPFCRESLMDPGHQIDGHPSVRLAAAHGGVRQMVRFSSIYGSSAVEYEHDIPIGAVIFLSCPHCGRTLRDDAGCPECDSAMAPMLVDGGGLVRICTKRSCMGHTLDLTLDYF